MIRKALAGAALLALLLLSLAIAQKISTPKYSSLPQPTAAANVIRGAEEDLWADTVIGQPDFHQAVPKEITLFKVAGPGGVVIDRSRTPNRVYIYDGMNSRILGYRSLGVCIDDLSSPCTADSDCGQNGCQLQIGGVSGQKYADITIGQPLANTSACNGNGTYESYPDRAKAEANSICSIPQETPSFFEYGSFASMDVDGAGNLFVADFFNNRILKYIDPFGADIVADAVWGQDDFTGIACNNGQPSPNANGLCFIHDTPNNPLTGGVDIDQYGNLWVADSGNNRVLRFPNNKGIIQKTADLVLGQPDFISKGYGSSLNQLFTPAAVRVNDTREVFVADSDNNRILRYRPPLVSGQAGTVFGSNFRKPTGIEFDVETGDPTTGGVWVQDTNNNQLVLFDDSGNVKKTLFKENYRPDGACNLQGSCLTENGEPAACLLCDARGSIGITSDGDIVAAGSLAFQDAYFYKHPIPLVTPGAAYSAAARFFYPPEGHNYLSDKGFLSPRGIAVTDSQFIVADAQRIMFWNTADPANQLTSGQPADGVAGVADFTTFADPHFSGISASNSNLWVIRANLLERYSLPLKFGQIPELSLSLNQIRILGSPNQIGYPLNPTDIIADPDDRYLWLALSSHDRVIRLRIPENINGEYFADIIIGGDGIPPADGTWGRPCPQYPKLCSPGSIALDRYGHLYVSSYYLEVEGNGKFYRFDAGLFPENLDTAAVFDASDTQQQFSNVFGWRPAFNNNNQMVLGFAAYTGSSPFPAFYQDILNQSGDTLRPDDFVKDYYSQAFTAIFDWRDNLFLADLNRGRVLIYKTPFGQGPTPRPSPPITPTLTPPPQVTPTPIPTPTPPANANPVITTSSLPVGVMYRNYRAAVAGYDADAGAAGTMIMSASGLPTGLKLDQNSCQTARQNDRLTITCSIIGSPRQTGTFPVTITLQDNRGGRSEMTYLMRIVRSP